MMFKTVEEALLYYHWYEWVKLEEAQWHMRNVSRNFKEVQSDASS